MTTVSHQVVACVTTVGVCLSKCCSSSVINTRYLLDHSNCHSQQLPKRKLHHAHLLEVIIAFYKAIAAGLVSPASTEPLFPVCLVSPISANSQRTLMIGSEGHTAHVGR